jgi:hypothetical protein
MFRSSTIIRELVLSLAKVILKHSGKVYPYRLCGGVAACLGVACVLCAVQSGIELGAVRLCGGVSACLGVACVLCAVQSGTELGAVRLCGGVAACLQHKGFC